MPSAGESAGPDAVTKNKRYEAHFDALNDQRMAQASADLTPCTLPRLAYGPVELSWAPREAQPEIWAWITWKDAPASRVEAVAAGWNDRVVVVEWESLGGRRSVVVWRNAVTHR